ncbi:unnamed protein product [Cuscuta epithymum]|uniref:Uncharacterized protein n=2 Tax=Cuscuta epithymum TaxID=186058 RepID=A0AAV0G312_9ASTE|nr:unnamed protein product [Cuscuta epithymum]
MAKTKKNRAGRRGRKSIKYESHEDDMKWEVEEDGIEMLKSELSKSPTVLKTVARYSDCSIFHASKSSCKFNDDTRHPNRPEYIEIGPYKKFDTPIMSEEHKVWCMNKMLERLRKEKGWTADLTLMKLFEGVKQVAARARKCYVVPPNADNKLAFTPEGFVKMLVLDGCFIVELFRREGRVVVPPEKDDPLKNHPWICSLIRRDLILVQNQVPFFVLECLFELTSSSSTVPATSLPMLALHFFRPTKYPLERKRGADHVVDVRGGSCSEFLDPPAMNGAKTLLDLLRMSYFVKDYYQAGRMTRQWPTKIPCISKLKVAGIEVKCSKHKSDSFLAVRFNKGKGVMKMPPIELDDFMWTFLRNCVAYEMHYDELLGDMEMRAVTYVILLDCLIETEEDVQSLYDAHILAGTHAGVVTMVKQMGKELRFDDVAFYTGDHLMRLFPDVDVYYNNPWHVQRTAFNKRYFKSPLSVISLLVTTIVLLLTIIQTIYAVLAYHFSPHARNTAVLQSFRN